MKGFQIGDKRFKLLVIVVADYTSGEIQYKFVNTDEEAREFIESVIVIPGYLADAVYTFNSESALKEQAIRAKDSKFGVVLASVILDSLQLKIF